MPTIISSAPTVKIIDKESVYCGTIGKVIAVYDAGMYDPNELFLVRTSPTHSGMFLHTQLERIEEK